MVETSIVDKSSAMCAKSNFSITTKVACCKNVGMTKRPAWWETCPNTKVVDLAGMRISSVSKAMARNIQERWVTIKPLGSPVEPEVKRMIASESSLPTLVGSGGKSVAKMS